MSALVGQLLQIPLRHEIGLAKSNLSNRSLSLKQYAVYNTMRHCLRLWKMITSAIIQQLCIIIVDDCRLKHQPKDPLKALDVELLYKEAGQNSCCIMLHGITAIFFCLLSECLCHKPQKYGVCVTKKSIRNVRFDRLDQKIRKEKINSGSYSCRPIQINEGAAILFVMLEYISRLTNYLIKPKSVCDCPHQTNTNEIKKYIACI